MKLSRKLTVVIAACAMLFQPGTALPAGQAVITAMQTAADDEIPEQVTALTPGKAYEDRTASCYAANWYKFTTSSDGYFTLDFSRGLLNNTDTLWEITIYQYDNTLETLGSWDADGNTEKNTTCEIGVPAGVYYIKINANGNPRWSDETYSVKVNFTADDHYETEFNDTFRTADRIVTDERFSGTVKSRNDVDWYKFKTDTDGYFTVDFIREVQNNTSMLWEMTIYQYDNDVQAIASWEADGNTDQNTTCELGMPAGEYYIKINAVGSTNWSNKRYSLQVNFTADDHYETEFNDTYETADTIVPGRIYSGSTALHTDVDWYTFTTKTAGYFTIDFITNMLNHTDTLWKMTLYKIDNSLEEIASWDRDGNTLISTTCDLGMPAGSYAIKIRANSSEYTSKTRYCLRVNFTETGDYETEVNDSIETADRISLNQPKNGSIMRLHDNDVYSFETDGSHPLAIDFTVPVAGRSEEATWSIILYSYEDSPVQLARYTIEDGSTHFSKSGINLSAGRYYFRIASSSSTRFNSTTYRFTVSSGETATAAVSNSGQTSLPGDLNRDGTVDVSDAVLLLQYCAELGAGNTTLNFDEWTASRGL